MHLCGLFLVWAAVKGLDGLLALGWGGGAEGPKLAAAATRGVDRHQLDRKREWVGRRHRSTSSVSLSPKQHSTLHLRVKVLNSPQQGRHRQQLLVLVQIEHKG